MKLIRRAPFFLILPLLIILPGAVFSLELRFSGGLGNGSFDPGRTAALGTEGLPFEPRLYPLGSGCLEGGITDALSYGAGYDRDPVLRNQIYAALSADFSLLHVEFGPVMGILNTGGRILNPGVSLGLGLEYPGVIFGSLKGSSTLGSTLSLPGDYIQAAGEASLGFWVPQVICTLSVTAKSFSERRDEALITKDEIIRYQFSADTYSKNVPYTIQVNMGYQSLKRSYSPALVPVAAETDELHSLYMGLEGSWRVNPRLRLFLGGEMPIYTWAEKPLKRAGTDTTLYMARAGFAIILGKI